MEVVGACGNLTVRLMLEFDFTLILLGFSLEDVVPLGQSGRASYTARPADSRNRYGLAP